MSAAEQVADRLVADLEKGTWTTQIPGLKTLARRYSVSHQTVDGAMKFIEQWGWVEAAEPRKPRQIRAIRPQRQRTIRNLLILHPQELIDTDKAINLRHQQAMLWTKHYESYALEPISAMGTRSAEKELDRLIIKHGAHAILLNNMPAHWGVAALARLPVYFSGGILPAGRVVNNFSLSISKELSKTYRVLRALGHQRILLAYSSRDSGIRDMVLQLDESPKSSDDLIGLPEDYCVRLYSTEPNAWEQMWAKELNRLRPTAIITFEAFTIPSLYSYSRKNGKKIPNDYSLVCLEHLRELEYLSPRPQMLRFDYPACLRHFERWLQAGLNTIGHRTDPLEWDPKAESIADRRQY